MKAAVRTDFGPPDVLQIRDVPVPDTGSSEILIRVRAADVSPSDCYGRSGMAGAPAWMRMVIRAIAPIFNPSGILGTVLAGDVEKCGKRVIEFKNGDRVFAFTGIRGGSHAEYARVRAKGIIAKIPDNVSYADAAATVYGGLIASACLRRVQIRPGDSVLIYGASGAIGSAAVQLAVNMGATVTGVSSAANSSLVKSLGAHATLAYDSDDQPSADGYMYMLDAAGRRKTSALKAVCQSAILPGGAFISVDKLGLRLHRDDLVLLAALLENGRLKPTIDRTYLLDEIIAAHQRVETRHKRGSVVISLG